MIMGGLQKSRHGCDTDKRRIFSQNAQNSGLSYERLMNSLF